MTFTLLGSLYFQVKRAPDSISTATAAIGSDAVLELFFECSGSELVDPSWVGKLYHPEVTAQKDNKVCLLAEAALFLQQFVSLLQ